MRCTLTQQPRRGGNEVWDDPGTSAPRRQLASLDRNVKPLILVPFQRHAVGPANVQGQPVSSLNLISWMPNSKSIKICAQISVQLFLLQRNGIWKCPLYLGVGSYRCGPATSVPLLLQFFLNFMLAEWIFCLDTNNTRIACSHLC